MKNFALVSSNDEPMGTQHDLKERRTRNNIVNDSFDSSTF